MAQHGGFLAPTFRSDGRDWGDLRHLFLDVPDACPPREVVARLRTDRMSRRLAPLLALAKLLLVNRSPGLGRATNAGVGRPGLQRDFVIQGGGASRVVVRVMTVDLARLASVPGEVGEAVGGG